MKDILNRLFEQNILTQAEAKTILSEIAQKKYSEIEVASFLTVYKMRPITSAELTGFREALMELCIPIDVSDFNTIDVCGTGGDGKDTFNISTLSAFVLAGAGIKVSKHGNYGVSSVCGSSNILEHFGYRFSNDESKLKKELDQAGICYLHAPLFHPALKNVAPVRRALGVKTFFNILGPLVNPSKPQNQLAGVFSIETMQLYKEVFDSTGINYIVLHNDDGYDEISLTSTFSYADTKGFGKMSPGDFGFSVLKPEDLHGGQSVDEAAAIFLSILKGENTIARQNVVIANAAMGIKCVFSEKPLDECLAEASESLKSGKALGAFTKLIS